MVTNSLLTRRTASRSAGPRLLLVVWGNGHDDGDDDDDNDDDDDRQVLCTVYLLEINLLVSTPSPPISPSAKRLIIACTVYNISHRVQLLYSVG